ncbi:MAG TPA: EAL domain-containing protein [Polyangiaceae bacterium]|jgi:diguanylate cyclase (GGDEF)-like protein/PAS domain S-box-containing protein
MTQTQHMEPAWPGRKERVLLVDDEPQVLIALEDLLSEKFIVYKADSAARALELVEHERDIAVVVSDQRMPKMNGDELLTRVSSRCSASRILVTGYADLSAVIRAVNNGKIFAYVSKPWDPEDLQLTIDKGAEYFRLTRELAYERQLLRDLMNGMPDVIYFKDRALRFLRANRALGDMWNGGDSEGLVNKSLKDLGLDDETVASIEREELEIMRDGHAVTDRVEEVQLAGSTRWFSTTKAPIRAPDEQIVGLVCVAREVTERVLTEKKLARLSRIHAVRSGINSAIVRVKDRRGLLQETCRIAVREGELPLALIATVQPQTGQLQVSASDGGDEGLIDAIDSQLRAAVPGDVFSRALKSQKPCAIDDLELEPELAITAALLRHGHRALAVFPLFAAGKLEAVFALFSKQVGFDSEELKLLRELADNLSLALDHLAQGERLDFLAYYDELTKLPKRNLLTDRISQQLVACRNDGCRLAVVLLDVERFRHVNETLGRRGGDNLLLQIAERLKESLSQHDTLARFDSNSFAILIAPAENESELAARLERKILARLNESFTIEDTELRISVKGAVALFPSDGQEVDALVANAEAALKKAKSSGQRYLFYAPSMNERVREKLTLETKLRRAIEQDEFLLHYQPKVNLKSGRVVGLEALIRWQDPSEGLVPPGRFIPVLEETGLILDVGRWVMMRAAAQYTAWVEQGLTPPRIAVNVSAIQLGQRDFVRSVEQVAAEYPLLGAGLDLEITESVLIEDLNNNIEKLRAVKEQGPRVAIDDFGTGYSSLGYLSRLPIDALKVDRSFVIRMAEDSQDMAIVTTIISLAHALDLTVIAEGVETANQAHLLRLLRCDQIQGYLVAKPLPAEQVLPLLNMTTTFAPPKTSSS